MFKKPGHFVVIFLSGFLHSCHPHEDKALYYSNGKVKYSYQVRAGKQEGISKAYFPSGALENQVSWVGGKQDGPAYFYYLNGKLKSTSTWKSGLSYGLSKAFYESGTLKQSAFQDVNGHLQFLREYDSNGKVKRVVKVSKLFKTVILFSATGKPIEKQLKSSDGTLLYACSYNKKSEEQPGIIVPLFQNETDTLRLGDTYNTIMHFGLKVDKNVRLVTSLTNKSYKISDTISFIPGREGEAFHITIKPIKQGQNKFYFKFVCFNCQNDTLHIDGVSGNHSFFVKSK